MARLTCTLCRNSSLNDLHQMVLNAGMAKREKNPTPELLWELAPAAASRLQCPECSQAGLEVEPYDPKSPANDEEAFDWPEARLCGGCRQPIPAERLEIFPDETLCARCRTADNEQPDQEEIEYCPHCGGILQLRTRQGKVTRYVRYCGDCRRSC